MKRIEMVGDLAINGAEPAFSVPLHVGKPNMGKWEDFSAYAKAIFESQWLSNNGPFVQELEKRIAEYHGVRHCVATCNGTVALEIAVRALGLDGEVIIPSYTFVATAHALSWQAIVPVFADIDPSTCTLDPESVRQMITPKTSGIIGVHLWGRAADVDELQKIADEKGLKLLFDAAHAFGCTYKGKTIGGFGECEVLSFHATKMFNTFEGGAVLTNNDELAKAVRLMCNFGFSGLDNVIYPGTNGKMIEMSAAMGLVNLGIVDDIIMRNKNNYNNYRKMLSNMPGIEVLEYDETEKNNYQYIVVEVKNGSPVTRDDLVKILHAENVLARKYFWPGCHRMKPYIELYPHAELLLPNTRLRAAEILVLPTGLAIDNSEIEIIAKIIRVAYDNDWN